MTLLSLIFAGAKSLKKAVARQQVEESVSHLDEHLLADIGLCRVNGRVHRIPTDMDIIKQADSFGPQFDYEQESYNISFHLQEDGR